MDVEFCAVKKTDDTAPSFASQPEALLASNLIFEVCVLRHPSGEVLIDEPVNFLPSDYKHGPIHYLHIFLGSMFIDQGPLNETRPSSSLDAEPPRPLKGISSWFDRGPRPGAIRTATM
jgi:hypothetical protein